MVDPIKEAHTKFTHRPLNERVILNSVPKCGTMLLRNIVLMFTPWDEIHFPWPSAETFGQFEDVIRENKFKQFAGHIPHSPEASVFMRHFRHVLLIRDPIDQVLSYARFYHADHISEASDLSRYIRDHQLNFDEVVGLVIVGLHRYFTGVNEYFVKRAIAWFDSGCFIIKYEDLLHHVKNLHRPQAKTYFSRLLNHLNIDMPSDWRQRVAAGADRKISSTSPENVAGAINERKELSPGNQALFLATAPTLHEALGYDTEAAAKRLRRDPPFDGKRTSRWPRLWLPGRTKFSQRAA